MDIIERIASGKELSVKEWIQAIDCDDPGYAEELKAAASYTRDRIYGKKVFARGLIEFTSYCRNDCYYCGLRRSNRDALRYRLSYDCIMDTAEAGYRAGFRTFVLQSGEDSYFTDERLIMIVRGIKERYPDAAVTLSVGERSFESYKALKDAGADRYLLRHETADSVHYRKLHPDDMSQKNRIRCLYDLKELGYQTGAGMMVGSPGSSSRTLAEDMVFLSFLKPEMVGIGPFIPHSATPFRDEKRGSVDLTLRMVSLVRLALPHAMIPSTTALATASSDGQLQGILHGANVIMPDITPQSERSKYMIYDGKKITGDEAGENLALVEVPALTWAVFPNDGPHPETMQQTTARIYAEWLAEVPYELDGFRMLSFSDVRDDGTAYSEIWVPVHCKA